MKGNGILLLHRKFSRANLIPGTAASGHSVTAEVIPISAAAAVAGTATIHFVLEATFVLASMIGEFVVKDTTVPQVKILCCL